MDVGGLLRQARWSSELSQRQLARRVGVPPSTLSRYESGAGLPSLPMLDRILAACGKDVRFTLVHRHADLDDEVDRLGALSVRERVQEIGVLVPWFLDDLVRLPAVLVGGAWAAAVHGVPREHDHGRLFVAGDDASLEAVAAFLRPRPITFLEDGRWGGLTVRPGTFVRFPHATWRIDLVGDLDTVVVPPGEPWPLEVRVDTGAGPLRVVAPDRLGEDDGVRPEVLGHWLQRRGVRAAGPPG